MQPACPLNRLGPRSNPDPPARVGSRQAVFGLGTTYGLPLQRQAIIIITITANGYPPLELGSG